MLKRSLLLCAAVTAAGSAFLLSNLSPHVEGPGYSGHGRQSSKDNDWFMLQRVYPYDDVSPDRYERARKSVRSIAANMSEALNVAWQSAGPTNIGGRMTALVLHPTNPGIFYAGAAAGGVWKSLDAGITWTNVFNESPSIGSIIMQPDDPGILYVGTGEGNPGGVAIYPGNGVWKTTDGGQTWTNIGLNNVGQIGRMAVHPSQPNRIFAAALGLYRSRTQERGVYRSTDGGTNWERVLFLNDTTGATALLIDPADPNRILAAMWTRYRPITYSVITSANTGLYLSTDGGGSWSQVTNGIPSNDINLGRMSMAFSRSSPNIFYILASNGTGVRGVYKSTDSGNSWAQVATSSAFGSEGQVWYNNVIAVHPTDPNTLLAGMTSMYRSTNGGVNWSSITGTMHVDQHQIVFDPASPGRVIIGNDGGIFISANTGTSWTKSYNLPVSQFYAGTIDYSNPNRYYGGMQDNGTARTMTGSMNDWSAIYGGDGFYVVVDHINPLRVYAESQNGGLGRSTNGGTSFVSATTGISSSDRKNWNTPFVIDWSTPLTLYTGTHRVYRTTNGMANWTAISGDLTRGANGRLGTITTLDVAKSNSNVIYAGADDGRVHVTTNGGTDWVDISAGLPIRWVTRVAADPDSANVAYVTLSGYLEYAHQSHIYRTTDYGQQWVSIGGNLPDLPINDVVVDSTRPFIFIGTDLGVMYSSNYGTSWNVLGTGLPEVPVHDLTLHTPTRKLLASTHGRSSYLADLSGLTNIAVNQNETPATFTLHQNYPNPFNPSTQIRIELHTSMHINLGVYDIAGRLVQRLINNDLPAGNHFVMLDGSSLASGVYFVRLRSGVETKVIKTLLAK